MRMCKPSLCMRTGFMLLTLITQHVQQGAVCHVQLSRTPVSHLRELARPRQAS